MELFGFDGLRAKNPLQKDVQGCLPPSPSPPSTDALLSLSGPAESMLSDSLAPRGR